MALPIWSAIFGVAGLKSLPQLALATFLVRLNLLSGRTASLVALLDGTIIHFRDVC